MGAEGGNKKANGGKTKGRKDVFHLVFYTYLLLRKAHNRFRCRRRMQQQE